MSVAFWSLRWEDEYESEIPPGRSLPMARRTKNADHPELTPAQKAEADRLHAAMLEATAGDLRELAELLATTNDANIFGATEFTVRDIVMRVGAKAIQTALEERKKGGTTGPVAPVRGVRSRPGSSGGAPGPS